MTDHTAQEIAELLVRISHRVESKGFVAATDGNISARLPNGYILCTPTSVNKGLVRIEDLVEITPEGAHAAGSRKPSSEIKMHLYIYRHRSDVNAVVHCHPVYATGFAAARIPLKEGVFPDVIAGLGAIPLAPYATPSTNEVGDSLSQYVDNHDAVLLANHGAVTYGADLWDAYYKMEKVEQIAHMTFVAEMIGGAVPLDEHQKETVKQIYSGSVKK